MRYVKTGEPAKSPSQKSYLPSGAHSGIYWCWTPFDRAVPHL